VSEDERLERGRELARRYLGPETTARWSATSEDLERLTSGLFADVWARPALGLRERALIAMAITATLRAHTQLGWHVRGALGAGVSPDEVRETLIAVAGLAGFPAAWSALEVAEPILRDEA
jgi:alkylhydroperoxidase/carboxymuconolactone decarboxylase family protein YurZ